MTRHRTVPFIREIKDVEAGAYRVAADALLIGLHHIREHQMSAPMDLTWEEWVDVTDELIWYLEFLTGDKMTLDTNEEKARYRKASELLGRYFADIWC